jgi:hypothetical protein
METTYTVGVVAASMPQGGMCHAQAWLVAVMCGMETTIV